ncbi:polynucleotide kinase [Pseudomonas phage vB_PpuM-Peetri]
MISEQMLYWLKRAAPWKPILIVDIDGVVLNNEHRLHHIVHTVDGVQVNRTDADWVSFHANGHLDTPGAAAAFIEAASNAFTPVFVTARVAFGEQRKHVHDMLAKTLPKVKDFNWRRGCPSKDEIFPLFMRAPNENWEANKVNGGDAIVHHSEYKRVAIHWLRAQGINPMAGLDDSLTICKMFAEEGLLSLRVHNHVADAALMR